MHRDLKPENILLASKLVDRKYSNSVDCNSFGFAEELYICLPTCSLLAKSRVRGEGKHFLKLDLLLDLDLKFIIVKNIVFKVVALESVRLEQVVGAQRARSSERED